MPFEQGCNYLAKFQHIRSKVSIKVTNKSDLLSNRFFSENGLPILSYRNHMLLKQEVQSDGKLKKVSPLRNQQPIGSSKRTVSARLFIIHRWEFSKEPTCVLKLSYAIALSFHINTPQAFNQMMEWTPAAVLWACTSIHLPPVLPLNQLVFPSEQLADLQ